MNYWIISPNIQNEKLTSDQWGDLVAENKSVYIGYDIGHDLGLRFANKVLKGDLVIVAAKSNMNKKLYFAGIVADSKRRKYDLADGVFYKPLTSCVEKQILRSMKLDFTADCSNGDARQVKTITQLHPETKSGDKKIIDTIMEYMQSKKEIDSYCELLKTNKNIILTGAPGTGKTFLAKEIAANFIGISGSSKPIDRLKEVLKKFEPDTESRKENEESRQNFVKHFPLEKLNTLTLKQYCTGAGNQDSFCNWVENKLNKFGKFWPGQRGSRVYGIYYSTDSEAYISNANGAAEEIVTDITSSLQDAINDYTKIPEVKHVHQDFLMKLICLYKSDSYVPIFATGHIRYILTLFEVVEPGKNLKLFELSELLTDFYHKICKGFDITTVEFMELLYGNFGVKEKDFNAGWDKEAETIESLPNIDFVQFHPSYDYTDFVEGLRPTAPDGNGNIGFQITNGVFKNFCETARKNPDGQKYVFIIDEINRGEISKIFGELFFSIDPGYRGVKGRVKTQYHNLHLDEEGFYVPENVYIIGTMNDIDRSVESMDFAMRRRFAWVEVRANENTAMLNQLEDLEDEAKKRMLSLNNAIWSEQAGITGLNSSYHIGASYFLKLNNYKDSDNVFNELWQNHLSGVLFEYLRGMPDAASKLKTLEKAYNLDTVSDK